GDPGPFLAFCQGDLNEPGGCARWRGRLRLFDFDCGGFRPAPLGGPPGGLSLGAPPRLPAAGAGALGPAGPPAPAAGGRAAGGDGLCRRALGEAAARWHIFHAIWRLPTALERDYQRGLTRLRQQQLAWLEGFAAVAEECGHATALGSSARALAARLRAQWPSD